MVSLHPTLQPLFQLVEYSPSFIKVEVLDYTAFTFTQKKPWTDNEHHIGEELSYTCGLEKLSTEESVVYITCDNTGDGEFNVGVQGFVNYIQPTNLRDTWQRPRL